ncbi:hypothetical protein LHFGNBLO_004677 [Mesorhizobium sp. AR10]|uniref:hypothetical protein n=1 Tax=Mesorhizobium sp. AR10 TaxID=2865839 RepID=UPI002160D5FA|nr:hypothetical protein [Mesorhizobium sp. AR10]UVK37614.1 hypothetical protein LHFGNBLO_004677 [Mesorhizobium sp. AR10]
MKTIAGLYDTYGDAELAVRRLEDGGISPDDISIIAPDGSERSGSPAATGVGIGAAVGGIGGFLAGIGAVTVPGLGPVVGAGWLVSTLTGAAAGGVAGGVLEAFTDAGIDEADAHVYAEHVRGGGTMVMARVGEAQEAAATAILRRSATHARRSETETSGWSSDEEIPLADEARDDALIRKGVDPFVTPNFPR